MPFYWSVTLCTLPDLFLFDNPQHRYAISSRKPDLVRDGNGSRTGFPPPTVIAASVDIGLLGGLTGQVGDTSNNTAPEPA